MNQPVDTYGHGKARIMTATAKPVIRPPGHDAPHPPLSPPPRIGVNGPCRGCNHHLPLCRSTALRVVTFRHDSLHPVFDMPAFYDASHHPSNLPGNVELLQILLKAPPSNPFPVLWSIPYPQPDPWASLSSAGDLLPCGPLILHLRTVASMLSESVLKWESA